MKGKTIFYWFSIAALVLFLAGVSASCASKSYYVKKSTNGYKKVRGKQANWNTTTSLNTTYSIKKGTMKTSSQKKIKRR